MLDINLGGSETSEPIAQKLAASGIPFIAVSGYSREQLPAIFADVPFTSKPIDHAKLVHQLRKMASKQPARSVLP